MNQYAFRSLHFVSELGTDLTVQLPEGHIWGGGDEVASGNGCRFNPNIPTEEVFTTPDRRHDLLHRMDACTEETLPPLVRTSKCAGRQKCRFYEECFPEESSLPSGSVLTLIGAQHRYEMRDEGRIYLRDADEGRIEGTRQQYAQIMNIAKKARKQG